MRTENKKWNSIVFKIQILGAQIDLKLQTRGVKEKHPWLLKRLVSL